MRHNEMRNSSYKSFHRKRKIGRGHPKMMSSLEENGGVIKLQSFLAR